MMYTNEKSDILFDNLEKVNKFLALNKVRPSEYEDYYSDIYFIIDRSFDTMDLEKFNVEQYLFNFVRDAVGQHRLAEQTIYIPRDKRSLAWKVKKAIDQSLRDNGVEDSFDEVADKFGLTAVEVSSLYALAFVDSLDRQIGDDEDSVCLVDTIDVRDEGAEDALDALRATIRRCCAYLHKEGKVTKEDVKCFLALYSPEDPREGWRELDELLEDMGNAYNSTQALNYHIRQVRDALIADIFVTDALGRKSVREGSTCYRLLGGFAKGRNQAA